MHCNDKNNCKCNMDNTIRPQSFSNSNSNFNPNSNTPCHCGYDEDNGLPVNPMLAQSYVPIQQFGEMFSPENGLRMGTMYPDLVRVYCPNDNIRNICAIQNGNMIREGCNYAR